MIALYDTDGTVAKTVEKIRQEFENGGLPREGRIGRVSWKIETEETVEYDQCGPYRSEQETLYLDLGTGFEEVSA